jgi:hypothetical protein
MSTSYNVADMMVGVRNMIEAADVRQGDKVLLLADTRSDKTTMEAIRAGLRFIGAEPMSLVTEPIARYGDVPATVLEAMHVSDVVVWVWPVFITFTPAHRAMGRKREESGTQLHEQRMKPYHIYFEGAPGLLARDYAKFPNKVLWKLAEKVREVVSAGREVRIEDSLGSRLTATYDGRRLYGMQFRAGDPPGRCHFPWGRCGVFNGDGIANGEVHLTCVQGIAGKLPEPMRWKVKDSVITEVDGGAEAGEECRRLFKEVPESNRLIEIMFGYHPKASAQHGVIDPMPWELISKMPWVGLGTPRKHPNFRHIDGSVFNGRLFIDDRLVVDSFGMLDRSLLHHPDVLAVASEYGDPFDVLAPMSHAAHGSGTLW